MGALAVEPLLYVAGRCAPHRAGRVAGLVRTDTRRPGQHRPHGPAVRPHPCPPGTRTNPVSCYRGLDPKRSRMLGDAVTGRAYRTRSRSWAFGAGAEPPSPLPSESIRAMCGRCRAHGNRASERLGTLQAWRLPDAGASRWTAMIRWNLAASGRGCSVARSPSRARRPSSSEVTGCGWLASSPRSRWPSVLPHYAGRSPGLNERGGAREDEAYGWRGSTRPVLE